MPDMTFATASGAPGRLTLVGGPRPGATTVLNVPPGCGPRVMLKLARVVFYPVPDNHRISYDDLMALRDGQIVVG